METYTIVRPEHLNHQGYLFGGMMLKWVDEYAWIAASLDFTDCTMVTVGMNAVVFRQRVVNGTILRFDVRRVRRGTSSATYAVRVLADEPGGKVEKEVFSTEVTFVRLGEDGAKQPLPACKDGASD